jgi:hypothetical protein
MAGLHIPTSIWASALQIKECVADGLGGEIRHVDALYWKLDQAQT